MAVVLFLFKSTKSYIQIYRHLLKYMTVTRTHKAICSWSLERGKLYYTRTLGPVHLRRGLGSTGINGTLELA